MKDEIYQLLLNDGDLNAVEIKNKLGINESIHKYVMELETEKKVKRIRCFTDKRIYTLRAFLLDEEE
jgi:predicted transcriptional regulator